MTDPDRPPQRRVLTRIYTPTGWVRGTLHVSENQPLLGFLNDDGPHRQFFSLTEAVLPGQSKPLPFLALQRHAAILVVAEDDHIRPKADTSGWEQHRVSCLFQGGLAMGTLTVPEGVRVSDHLMADDQFFALEHCTVGVDQARGKTPTIESDVLVLVQARRIFGVAQMG